MSRCTRDFEGRRCVFMAGHIGQHETDEDVHGRRYHWDAPTLDDTHRLPILTEIVTDWPSPTTDALAKLPRYGGTLHENYHQSTFRSLDPDMPEFLQPHDWSKPPPDSRGPEVQEAANRLMHARAQMLPTMYAARAKRPRLTRKVARGLRTAVEYLDAAHVSMARGDERNDLRAAADYVSLLARWFELTKL